MSIPGIQSLMSFIHYLFPQEADIDVLYDVLPFGASEWQIAGLSVHEPAIPAYISKHLDEPCPFWADKLVRETHFLYLVPDNVNLNKLYELNGSKTNSPFIRNSTDFSEKPYWVLLTKKPIPNTGGLWFEQQKEIASCSGYRAPTILEASVAVISAKRIGFVIFPSKGQDTRCKTEGEEGNIAVGSDSQAPFFSITIDDSNCPNGLAGVYTGL